MPKIIYISLFIILISGCASSKIYVDAEKVEGLGAVVYFPTGKIVPIKVRRIISGNIIELTNKEQVLYIGVYIPELYNIPRQARELNKRLIEGNDIRLEFDEKKRDSRGRLLAYIYTKDGRLINLEIIKEGLAEALVSPPNLKYKDLFLEAEKQARGAGRGIWSLALEGEDKK